MKKKLGYTLFGFELSTAVGTSLALRQYVIRLVTHEMATLGVRTDVALAELAVNGLLFLRNLRRVDEADNQHH